jgi:hypothetical protein
MAQDSKVFGRMVFANAAVVFTETDVQTPVQVVFDSPMVANGLGDSRSVTFEAGDEIGRFGGGLCIDLSLASDHADCGDARPLVFAGKPVDIVGCKILPGFNAAMLAISGLVSVEGAVGRVLKKKSDVLMERRLIFFNLDDIIGLFFDYGLGDFFLAAHRIYGDNGALQGKGFDQFWNGGDFIGFVIGLELAQHQSELRSPGTDHVYGRLSVGFVVRSAKSFAIDGHRFSLDRFGELLNPAGKEVLEAFGVDPGK